VVVARLTLPRSRQHEESGGSKRHRSEVQDDEEGHLVYKPGDTLHGRSAAFGGICIL
jgi:hypothetical protein